MNRMRVRLLIGLVVAAALAFGASPDLRAAAKAAAKATAKAAAKATGAQSGMSGQRMTMTPQQMKQGRPTQAQRQAAAKKRLQQMTTLATTTGVVSLAATAAPGGTPDYFGNVPNYADSPLPVPDVTVTITDTAAIGSGATAVATTFAADGGIAYVAVTNGGAGYSQSAPPQVTITSNGTLGGGAAATAAVNLTGQVIGVTVTNPGAGYPVMMTTIPDGTTTRQISTGLRKFIDPLPGLYISGVSNCSNGQTPDIPVAVPNTTAYPGSDYYEIELGEYEQRMHSDLPLTKLRGYRQTNSADPCLTSFHYLGPIIVAQKDKPVRVKFTNKLPIGAGGDLFIPTDTTYMGAGTGPDGTNSYKQNRATLHLHGGNSPWISDGTPHQWTVPANESTPWPKGVSTKDVPDMPATNPGEMTFYWTNQQSARLMFYHDHAYGITRLNVYVGEAAGYLVQDPTEQGLVYNAQTNTGLLPAVQVPLVIQDRTFVPDNTRPFANAAGTFASQLQGQDPTWDTVKWGNFGSLWYPHVYMPNQNPYDLSGANAMGRWDYGPWFWPPYTGLQYGPVNNPYYDPANAPWEPPMIPGTPNVSGVPEGFMDTPIVNGMAYPTLTVPPDKVRFRILNAANDRGFNLSLWQADSTVTSVDGRTNTEVKMVPWNSSQNKLTPFPTWWYDTTVPNPFDDRIGGVPDPGGRGPAMIQIGTEGGFLTAPALIKNQPVNYVMNKRDITVGNVAQKALFLGAAERADVVVDFKNFAGKTLILYNDAPAPIPAADPRLDYFTNDMDQTETGGAPTTIAGFGPNTRTVMQIVVQGSGGTAPVDDYDQAYFTALETALADAFTTSQHSLIVPKDYFGRIQDTSMTFPNGTVSGVAVTPGGSGYTSLPAVGFTGGGGTGAAGTAVLVPTSVASVTVTNGGTGYTDVPNVAFSNGVAQKATGAAVLTSTSVATITVLTGGSKYTSTPTVTISGCNGSGATATAVVTNRVVTAINVINHGSGFTCLPTVTISGGGGSGATAKAVLSPTFVASVTIGNGGSGYTAPPTVTFSGGGGTGAQGTAVLTPTSVASVTLTSGGVGYTSAPTVTFTGGGGSGAAATTTLGNATIGLGPKAIQELFTTDYGRMNATLGVEIPNTNATTQTTIPYGYIEPPTEIVTKTANPSMTAVGALGDGTQIWKITHNGVDTHPVHFHLFDVQLINRVGWDGAIRPPDANELGWKDTVRMSPLEDAIVALRPLGQTNLPFDLPNSIRPMDVTAPLGSTLGFSGVDPNGNPVAVSNALVNFGYEYVWHCHILGHEENDFMRAMAFAVSPKAPGGLAATATRGAVQLTWKDNSVNETGFTIERATVTGGVVGAYSTTFSVGANVQSYVDTTATRNITYSYRVRATNVVGYTGQPGFPTVSADSDPSNALSITAK